MKPEKCHECGAMTLTKYKGKWVCDEHNPTKIGKFNLLKENICDEACKCGWNLHIGGANAEDLDKIKNFLEGIK